MADPAYYALGLAILAVVLLIGLAIFVAFLFWKVYKHHEAINKIVENAESTDKELAKLEDKVLNLSALVKNNGLEDGVVYRHRHNDDSAIDVRDDDNVSERHPNSNHEHTSSSSIEGPTRPSVVVKINKDIANIFGHAPPDTQVIGIVQAQHKEKTANDVGVDGMDFRSEGISRQYMSGTTKRQTIYEGRPTSVLLDNATMTPGPSQKGIFVHKRIGKDGGILDVYGIKLVIHAGALNKDTQITLGATWDTAVFPNLDRPKALLSPILVCQPSIKFSKNVILSFPHCAEETQDWKFQMLHRENDLQQQGSSEWKELQNNENTNLEIGAYRVTLKVDHFTLFCLTGQSSSSEKVAKKAVKLLAFTSPFQSDNMFKVLIYCINNYDRESTEMKTIEEETTSIDMKKADVMQPLVLQDNNEDITVTLRNVTTGWKLVGDKTQSIDFESAWHSLSPSCKFIFNPANDKVRKIICDFMYNQNPSKKFRSIKIAEEHVQFSPLALQDKLGGKTQTIMQKLILLMDPHSDNDWRYLAEKIGYTYDKIRWLETQTSPTEIMLKKYTEDGKALSELKKPLTQIGRLDAVSEIVEIEKSSKTSSSV